MTALTPVGETHSPPIALRGIIRGVGLAGLGLIAILVGLSDVIARAPAGAVDVGPQLVPPSLLFPFGTDQFGRDVASETLHALAVTVDMASIAMLVTIVAGALGFVAARLPLGLGLGARWVAGILAAVPALFLAVLFIGASDRAYAPIAAGLAAAPFAFARAFDRARDLGKSAHAVFARATGISAMTLLRRDLAYEFRATFLMTASRALAAVAIILSTVSFFGFSAAPPHRDLGSMIATARETYFDAWWTAAFPALALALLILCARLAAALEEGERP
jgi:peptide/nickel transport system permease protein